jgi:DNA anti-recombination protein RmuC
MSLNKECYDMKKYWMSAVGLWCFSSGLALADAASSQIQMLNSQIQAQLQQMQESQQKQLKTLNTQIQTQIKQLQSSLQDQMQTMNTSTQKQLQTMNTTLQQQIKQVHDEKVGSSSAPVPQAAKP